jgi:hypothetical protein
MYVPKVARNRLNSIGEFLENNVSSITNQIQKEIAIVDEDNYYNIPTPNHILKVFNVCPFIEILGFVKDHRSHFKEHWIQSRILEPGKLKEELRSLFEMEFFFGSLYLGVLSSIYFAVMDDEISNQFINLEISKLGENYFLLLIY